MFLDPLRAPAPDALRLLCIALAVSFPFVPAAAQTATPAAPAASTPSAEMTPAERAKRDAENVFRWITIHADKPRKAATPPAKEEKPPTVVRVKAPATVAATPAPASTASATTPVVASNAPVARPEAAAPAPSTAPSTNNASPAPEAVAPRASLSAPSAAVANAPPVAAEEEVADTLTPLSQTEPKFPINLVRTLRSGQVQVRFTVQTDGSVSEPTVVTTTNARLNAAALAAVSQWRFAPVHKPQQGVVDLGFNSGD